MKRANDGPFTNDYLKHWQVAVKTQHGIIEYMEGMAQVLAEAGRASSKATGDSPQHAVYRWAELVRGRALEILKEDKRENPRRLPQGPDQGTPE